MFLTLYTPTYSPYCPLYVPKVQTRRICFYTYNIRGSLKGTRYLKSDSYADDFATLQSNMRLPG